MAWSWRVTVAVHGFAQAGEIGGFEQGADLWYIG
jgi:hypothetical protein